MDPNGLGLDGIGRVAACALVGLEPQWKVEQGDPVRCIIDANARRRTLSEGVKAMAVAIGEEAEGKRVNRRWRRGTKTAIGRSSDSGWLKAMHQAGVVLDHARELSDKVLAGGMALDEAYKTANKIKQRKEELDGLDPKLLALVESKSLTLEEALERVHDEERMSQLSDDLAERVQSGSLSLDEAEDIQSQRQERVRVWATKIQESLQTLAPMIGAPIPDEIVDLLEPDELEQLKNITEVK
jgi:hypothetical protein